MKTFPTPVKSSGHPASANSKSSASRSAKLSGCPATQSGNRENVAADQRILIDGSSPSLAPTVPEVRCEPPPPSPTSPQGKRTRNSNIIKFPRSPAPDLPEQLWIVGYTTISNRFVYRRARSAEQAKDRLRASFGKSKRDILGDIAVCFPACEMVNGQWFPPPPPPEAADLGAGI